MRFRLPLVSASSFRASHGSSTFRYAAWSAVFGGVTALVLLSQSACVVDRTGQSRSLTLQQELALTHTQLQALQRQVDDELSSTTSRLEQAEASAQLSRRNLADSGALLTTMVMELQALRGTFEQMSLQVNDGNTRLDQYQADVDFRLREFEKRITALEKAVSEASVIRPISSAQAAAEVVASAGSIDGVETLKRAWKYHDAGDFKTCQAFLKDFQTRFPKDAGREDAQFLLGQCQFKDLLYADSIKTFLKLIDDFPKSARIPEAMYQQGEAFFQLGEKEDARLFFNELVRAYPNSPEAKKAKARIEALGPEP